MASKFKLLNIDANAKTVKGQARGYMTAILYLSPSPIPRSQMRCPMLEPRRAWRHGEGQRYLHLTRRPRTL
jgi:hypothetical protein